MDAEVDVPIAADLLGLNVHLNQPGVLRQHGFTRTAREESEPGTQDKNDIRSSLTLAVEYGEIHDISTTKGIICRNQPVGPTIREYRNLRSLNKIQQMRAQIGKPRSATEQNHRAFG